jgi:hopene-associated glycosyltransferase HpnB
LHDPAAALLICLAALPLAIWIYLLFGRGGFWRIRLPERVSAPQRRVVAVVPARNEAEFIGETVRSLIAQNLAVIVVDDYSFDGTADAAAQQSAVVIKGKPLPLGWTGKLWALSQGVEQAMQLNPDYLLFTDADIFHSPGTVATLVAIAESRNLDMCSFMVKLSCEDFAERALIPAFVYFFLQLYPPAWIESPHHRTAGAAGGCILIRPAALERIGELAALKGEIIDDCSLAALVKSSGGRIWMGLTDSAVSKRPYGGFSGIGAMISRSAFNQLRHSALLLLGTVVGLFVTYLLPPLLLFSSNTLVVGLGVLAWLLMTATYLPMIRFYKLSAAWSLALPAIAVFYLGATIHSAVRYWQGKGGKWKGRVQDL